VYLTVRLNVQPLGSDELSALPEGERTIARVKTFGDTEMISADEHSGITGDLLLYSGKWYECKSCVHWLHTPLTHYEAEWVIRANNEQSDQLTVNSEQFCSC
jgi:hypothetical protein